MFSIRGAEPKDSQQIADFNQRLAQETEDKSLDVDTLAAGVRRAIEGRMRYFLAEQNGRVVGQAAVTHEWSDWRNGNFWWLASVYVLASHRGQGVFRALWNHIEEAARSEPDACGLRLYVERDNTTAQTTYAKLGMTETDYRLFEVEF